MNESGESTWTAAATALRPDTPRARHPGGHHDGRGDPVGVVLNSGAVEGADGPASEVGPRIHALRREVGHLVIVSRQPKVRGREGVKGAELVDVRVGEAEDLGHASSATTAPTPAIDATRSPSSSRMMITPRVWRPETRTWSSGMRIT